MIIVETKSELQAILKESRNQSFSIGFVPTMGALHAGHISLVERCVRENQVSVVSIFVTPTHFNDPNDLRSYPRAPEADIRLLENAGCQLLFRPSVQEMYPEPDTRHFDFGPLSEVMEGRFRQGHFNGVAQIVSRLLELVKPDRAYFGEKDFQQLAIIRELVKRLDLPVQIVPCPTIREPDGLAMSSRNQLLSPEERKKAPLMAELLAKSRTFALDHTVAETIDFVKNGLAEEPLFRLDYFEICNGYTLQPVDSWESTDYLVGCIAAYCGSVRLIDNIVYKHVD